MAKKVKGKWTDAAGRWYALRRKDPAARGGRLYWGGLVRGWVPFAKAKLFEARGAAKGSSEALKLPANVVVPVRARPMSAASKDSKKRTR